MFRSELEQDLKAIFEVDRVIYGDIDFGSEQDALYIRIDDVKCSPNSGKYYFRVKGSIGSISLSTINRYGFFHERAMLSKWRNKERLGLSSKEDNQNFNYMNDFFVKSGVNFTYKIEIPFNPPVGKIEYSKIKWVKIMTSMFNFLKGKINGG